MKDIDKKIKAVEEIPKECSNRNETINTIHLFFLLLCSSHFSPHFVFRPSFSFFHFHSKSRLSEEFCPVPEPLMKKRRKKKRDVESYWPFAEAWGKWEAFFWYPNK